MANVLWSSQQAVYATTQAIWDDVIDQNTCKNCGRLGTTAHPVGIWAGDGGSLAYSHGLYTYWCELCMKQAQLAHAEKCAESIAGLKARIRELDSAERV